MNECILFLGPLQYFHDTFPVLILSRLLHYVNYYNNAYLQLFVTNWKSNSVKLFFSSK